MAEGDKGATGGATGAKDKNVRPGEATQPPQLEPVIPNNLRVAVWVVTSIVALFGGIKSLQDTYEGVQNDLRDRAKTEVQFFEDQYDADQKLIEAAGTPGVTGSNAPTVSGDSLTKLLSSNVDVIANRMPPSLDVGLLPNWPFQSQIDNAKAQVCGARASAFQLIANGSPSGIQQHLASDHNSAAYQKYTQLCGDPLAGTQLVSASQTNAPAPSPNTLAGAAPTTAGARPALQQVGPLDCSKPPPAGLLVSSGAHAPTIASAGPGGDGWRIDVFWCARPGSPGAPGNYAAACRAYNAVLAQNLPNSAKLSSIKLRELPPGLPGYPTTGDELAYYSTNAEESAMAQQLRPILFPNSDPTTYPTVTATTQYIGAFACSADP